MNHTDIAKRLDASEKNIILIYAFNCTGKTRLSIAYKDLTKQDGHNSGVYYNAFSEDLFVWDNDHENNEQSVRLLIQEGSLNKYHSSLSEDVVREKLEPYNFDFDFSFDLFDNPERGIRSITFFPKDDSDQGNIKISRGEERIFVWCFFLALFELEDLKETQNKYFFIDDPVSSLDDHNLFITAISVMRMIEEYERKGKIIITTHHIGFFSLLANWITKGEKASTYKDKTDIFILSNNRDGSLSLNNPKRTVLLYHLYLLSILNEAEKTNELSAYHMVILRQALENIASFLGVGRFSFVLEKLGFRNSDELANMINILSHKNIFAYESEMITNDNKDMIIDILNKLRKKYDFVLHEE